VVLEHHTRVALAVSRAFLEVRIFEFSVFRIFRNFKKKYDKNTPVSPILVVIRVYKLKKKGEQVKNTMATAYEFVRKLL